MTGVIIDVNNIPLSLKNSFLFLFINANTVLINAHLPAFPFVTARNTSSIPPFTTS